MIAYQDSFPRCEDEHNVIAFGNCSLIPQLIKPIEHNSKHYSRHKVTYSYDPQAKCPQWKTFLRQIFGQNQDYKQKVYLLQEYMGLSLTNITKFQKMIMLIGIGSNGKSVILKVVGALVGEGNMSKVSLKDLNNKFNLVSLNGKLVNIDCDLDVDSLNSDAKFKAIVAGEEMVLENKFERTFKSLVEVKLWAAGNAFPNVKNDSHGYYRRIIPLMFTRVIEEGEENRNLDEQLLKELPGILNWALKGLKRLIKNGNFTIPQSSREALLDYKISNNSVTRFFNEKLELIDIKGSPKSGILSSELFNAYKKFSVENGFPSISDSVFGTKLKALSVNIAKSNGKRYYSVKFRDEIEDNEAEVEEEESV
jgi:putative DNA primase/helicase